MLLATGSVDVEPDLPDLPDAVRRGLVRYCPICDGYEARGRAHRGDRPWQARRGRGGLHRAHLFGRCFAAHPGLSLDDLEAEQRERLEGQGVKIVEEPIAALDVRGRPDRGAPDRRRARAAVRRAVFGARAPASRGARPALGAERDADGSLLVDAHNQTTVKGLYAIGGVARGLDQVVVAMGHAAVAATDIHNRCELPTEEEPDDTGRSRNG